MPAPARASPMTLTHPPPPDTPRRLGPYALHEQLGEGAFGSVHRATDTRWGDEVAIKRLHEVDPEDVDDLANEFRALADLHHPNLVGMYGLERAGDEVFLVMERVDGVPLDRWSPPGGRDGAAWKATLGSVLDGLEHLHRQGILHLDLKPRNLLVRPDGTAVLVDFGFARRVGVGDDGVAPVGLRGTLAFMAPELLRGDHPTPATDVYALGVLLSLLATGTLPSAARIQALVANGTPVLPEHAPDTMAPWIDHAVIRAATTPDPTARPPLAELRRVLDLPAPAHAPTPGALPFVGRDAEVTALVAALRDDEAIQLVVGPTGIGKTRLLDAVCGTLRSTRTRVLRSRSYPNDHTPFRALAPLVRLLGQEEDEPAVPLAGATGSVEVPDPLGSSLRSSAGAERGVDQDALLDRVVEGLRERLGDVPTVCALDDAQWADADSATLLARIRTASPPLPLRVVLSARPGFDDAPFFRQLTHQLEPLGVAPWAPPRTLAPLDDDAVARLLDDAGPEATRPEARRGLVEAAGGNPFLLQALLGGGTPEGDASAQVHAMIRHRLADLPDAAERLLRQVALAGMPTSRRVLQAAAAPVPDARRVFHVLRARRLITSPSLAAAGQVQPYHDRVRESVVKALPEAARRDGHAALARAYADHEPSAWGPRAVHEGGAGHPEAAAHLAARAGDLARHRGASLEAARWYERSLAWDASDPESTRERTTARARALLDAGRTLEAAPAFEEAARLHEGTRRQELTRLAAHAALGGGAVDEGIARFRSLLDELGEPWPAGATWRSVKTAAGLVTLWLGRLETAAAAPPTPEEALRADAIWSLGLGLSNVRPMEAVWWIVRSATYARQVGDPERAARGLGLLGATLSAVFPSADNPAQRALARAAAVAQASDDTVLPAFLDVLHAHVANLDGAWETAHSLAQDGLSGLSEVQAGTHGEETLGAVMGLFALDQMGDLTAVRSWSRRVAEGGASRGELYAQVVGLQFEAFARALAGETGPAAAQADWVDAHWTDDHYTLQHFYSMRIRAHAALIDGDAARARQIVEAARGSVRAERLDGISTTRIAWNLLDHRATGREGALAPGDVRRLQRIAKTLRKERRRDGAAHAATVEARLALHRGETAETLRLLDDAAERYDALRMRACAAAARARVGVLRDDPSAVASAHATLEALGAQRPEALAHTLVP